MAEQTSTVPASIVSTEDCGHVYPVGGIKKAALN